MMQYSRLIDSLIDECIAASLGGYDVADVVSGKTDGGELIREILIRTVCDPRFSQTVRVARAWQDDAHDLLEEFAQDLMKERGLSRGNALARMDDFLSRYFFTMVQRVSSPDTGRDGVLPAAGHTPSGQAGGGQKGSGDGPGGQEDGDGRKAQELQASFRMMAEGPAGDDGMQDGGEGRGTGRETTREEEREAELQYLRSMPSSLKRLARRIGRSDETEPSASGTFHPAARSDIAGITVGDDLGSLLPSEVALLAEQRTEDDFYRRFVGKRLQVFASASSSGPRPVRRQDGPVVICLDRSSSMEGRPSDLARAITLAVTIYARRRRREVTVVKYGNGSQSHFTVKNLRRQRRDLVRFLSYACAGGNNENEMFGWIFRELLPGQKPFGAADVLCVSDFGWMPVGEEVMGLIESNKARGMLFYGLDVTGEGLRGFRPADWIEGSGAWPADIIDSMWLWDDDRSLCREEPMKKVKKDGKI